jgi:hypothetical protein
MLELSGPNGTIVTAGPDTGCWPRLLAVLPAELQPPLEPVVGVRALLPLVRVTGSSVAGRLLDGRGQDRAAAGATKRPATIAGARRGLPGGLRLIPLRGVRHGRARGGRIAAGRRPGPRRPQRLRGALAAAGVDPDAPRRRLMRPELPAAWRWRRVLLSFLDEMDAVRDGTVGDVDIEFLHDFRVAVRRSRSVVKLLGDLLPAALVGWVTPRAEVARRPHTPLPRPRRPPAGAPVAAAGCRQRPAGGPGADGLHLRAAGERAAAAGPRPALAAVRAVARSAGVPRWTSWPGPGARPADRAEISAERVAGAYRRVLRRGSRITPARPRRPARPAQAVQGAALPAGDLRPHLDPDGARGAVKELKPCRTCWARSRTARRSARRSTRSPPT